MRAPVLSAVALSLIAPLTLGIAPAHARKTPAPTRIVWLDTLDAGLKQAKQSSRLVMVDFYTDWCGWCKKLDKDTYTDKQVLQVSGKIVAVKLDAERGGKAAAQKYGVQGFPTILFLGKDGEVFGKIVGYLPGKDFSEQMKKFVQGYKEFPVLKAQYAKDPSNLEAAAKLLDIYAAQGKTDLVDALLNRIEAGDPNDEKGFFGKSANAVGDMYQEGQQIDKAITYFRKTVQAGKTPKDVAYAHLSMAVCYLSQKKMDQGTSELTAAAAVPNAPRDLTDQANSFLKALKEQGKNSR